MSERKCESPTPNRGSVFLLSRRKFLTHVTQPDADSRPAVIPAKAGICEKHGFLLSQE